jgi:type 1 glutamine amidotransferase
MKQSIDSLRSRREMLKWSALFTGAATFGLLGTSALAEEKPPKKILFFTKSSGFQHSVIDRHGKDEPAYAEKILIDLGKKNNLDVTISKDGSVFTPSGLSKFDSIVFMTTGDLTQPGTDQQPPMPADGKQALIDAVAGGKGFAGVHCASDTFHSHGSTIDPYIALLGGEFVTHGSQQPSTCHVIDPKFPGAPDHDFDCKEEWYALTNFAPDLHMILLQQTKGMNGVMYQRPPYPSTWARAHGKGRVFYTSMGHREDVWMNPLFTNLLIGGIGWTAGLRNADVTPNIKQLIADPTK